MPDKQRHGCLTAYLSLMILFNVIAAFTYLSRLLTGETSGFPPASFIILGLVAAFNLVCVAALMNWKKWAFFGFIGSSIITLIVNLSLGLGPIALAGLTGVPILYWALRMGKERDGWSQLD
jgi:hypothetical protein